MIKKPLSKKPLTKKPLIVKPVKTPVIKLNQASQHKSEEHTAQTPKRQPKSLKDLLTTMTSTDQEAWQTLSVASLKQYGLSPNMGINVGNFLSKRSPSYKAMCRESVMRMVNELKLAKVEDLITTPKEYHHQSQCNPIGNSL